MLGENYSYPWWDQMADLWVDNPDANFPAFLVALDTSLMDEYWDFDSSVVARLMADIEL